MTGRAKTLLVMILLFLAITAAQYVAGVAAHSLSLQADCLSMLIDAISYCGNLVAECVQAPVLKERLQLGMSGGSIVLLAVFTSLFLKQGIENLAGGAHHGEGPDDAVNPYIVLGFAIAGLLFDAISLLVYYRCGHKEDAVSEDDAASEDGAEDELGGEVAAGPGAAGGQAAAVLALQHSRHAGAGSAGRDPDVLPMAPKTSKLNMLSALGHVLSDLARSLTTFVEGIVLFKYPLLDSVYVDGLSAVIVCSLIMLGTLAATIAWVRAFRRYQRAARVWLVADADDLALLLPEDEGAEGQDRLLGLDNEVFSDA